MKRTGTVASKPKHSSRIPNQPGGGLTFDRVDATSTLVVGPPGLLAALVAVGPVLERALDSARGTASRELYEAFVRVLTATIVQEPSGARQAEMLATAQTDLANEFGLYSAADLAAKAGSRAANRSALASRWEAEGSVFSVPWRGGRAYPGYLFDPADSWRPKPTVREVLPLLREAGLTEWEQGLWFTSRLGSLRDERPCDVLTSDPTAVLRAAKSEASPSAW